ncbi:hypothetical protein [Chondromyces crocatus]|uniref:Uncharacterized protein n=1 Tax=Chondromyces crocatus TaxID=52 RepID=A0A0K1EDY7_CHOCO|nr:hypothetical protein [Chondromyces crocatus]AKT39076.1 uncharacterized protein CMC5_032230 [Chondromyces crocatus]
MGVAFTALAIAEARANAVGAVRLVCGEERLFIDLLLVAWHGAGGFAPGAVVESLTIEVPYSAIRALFRHGRALCLALDPEACAPYNRFSLTRFTEEPVEALASAYQARQRAHVASHALPIPAGIVAALAAPADLASGPLGLASLAVVVATATWLIARAVVRSLSWGGPGSDRRRDALEAELSRRMGFFAVAPSGVSPQFPAASPAVGFGGRQGSRRPLDPRGLPAPLRDRLGARAVRRAISGELGAQASPSPATPREPSTLPALAGSDAPLGRPRAILPILAVAALVVATLAFVQRFAIPREPPALLEIARMGSTVQARANRWAELDPAALEPLEPSLPRCLCERADSLLWRGGVPRLSLHPSSGPDDSDGAIEPDEGEYDFDFAVVNNDAEPLRDVRVVLTFSRRDEGGRRVGITERGLFYEGLLRPGRAVKWHVTAPGTEIKVEPGVVGTLEGEPAPPEAYVALARARSRAVRIHAAAMLAYHRDPRALDALRNLGAPMPAEAEVFARIRRATAEVIPCDVMAQGGRLALCLFNASAVAHRGTTLRELSETAGSSARQWELDATLPVHEGLKLDLPLQGELPPELAVDLREGARP